MKRKELEELIKANTNEEGAIDIETIFKAVNEHVNEISGKNIEKEKEVLLKQVTTEAQNAFISEYGFENVDQFSAFVTNSKATTTEKDQTLKRINKELVKFKEDYGTLEKQYKDANSELTSINNKGLAKQIGVKEDMLDFALFEANKVVNDEVSLEDALNGLKESKPFAFDLEEKTSLKVGTEVKGKGEIKPTNYFDLYLKSKGKK